MADTGFPDADAHADFSSARRRARIGRTIARLRGQPDDVTQVLPYDEVVEALGRTGTTDHGLCLVPVVNIVGSVDRTQHFDRSFRPTSSVTRARWAKLNAAQRRGESVPPVVLRKIGTMYFVVDGHNRVSIARARGDIDIAAHVTEVHTRVDPSGIHGNRDIVLKSHRRVFMTRVPLPHEHAVAISLPNPWKYAELAECVEAWGFRVMQADKQYYDRETIAQRWFNEEFHPVVTAARASDIAPHHTDAELYLWIANERYRLIRKHEWPDDVFTKIREEGTGPT